jgi:hypothetical protein
VKPHRAARLLRVLPRPESIRQGFVVPAQNFGPPLLLGEQFGLLRSQPAMRLLDKEVPGPGRRER